MIFFLNTLTSRRQEHLFDTLTEILPEGTPTDKELTQVRAACCFHN